MSDLQRTNKVECGRWLIMDDGTVFGWNSILANNPKVREVSGEVAFPDRHIPEGQEGRESIIDLDQDPSEPVPRPVGQGLKDSPGPWPSSTSDTAPVSNPGDGSKPVAGSSEASGLFLG